MIECKEVGCFKPVQSKSLCYAHYQRERRQSANSGPVRRYGRNRTCEVPGCDKPHLARGLCVMHRKREERHGRLFTPFHIRSLVESQTRRPASLAPHTGGRYAT